MLLPLMPTQKVQYYVLTVNSERVGFTLIDQYKSVQGNLTTRDILIRIRTLRLVNNKFTMSNATVLVFSLRI